MRVSTWIGAVAATAALVAFVATAQAELKLPSKSHSAKVMATVGVTDVEVEYSSPGVKGRTIFGDLVKYDELWRTGANGATKITFSTDVKVDGKDVPAGTYAIFSIPGKKQWTLILNKNPNQGGTRSYDKELDQLRFTAKPAKIEKRERMTFIFANTTDDSTSLDLEWDTTRISFPITTDTMKYAMESIEAETGRGHWTFTNSARYILDNDGDAKKANAYADMALGADPNWITHYVKAQVLAKMGDNKGAVEHAEKAWELGNKDDYFFWKSQVKRDLAAWKK